MRSQAAAACTGVCSCVDRELACCRVAMPPTGQARQLWLTAISRLCALRPPRRSCAMLHLRPLVELADPPVCCCAGTTTLACWTARVSCRSVCSSLRAAWLPDPVLVVKLATGACTFITAVTACHMASTPLEITPCHAMPCHHHAMCQAAMHWRAAMLPCPAMPVACCAPGCSCMLRHAVWHARV